MTTTEIKKGDIVSPNHVGEEITSSSANPVLVDWRKYSGRVVSEPRFESPAVGFVVEVVWFRDAKLVLGPKTYNYPVKQLAKA